MYFKGRTAYFNSKTRIVLLLVWLMMILLGKVDQWRNALKRLTFTYILYGSNLKIFFWDDSIPIHASNVPCDGKYCNSYCIQKCSGGSLLPLATPPGCNNVGDF